MTTPNKEAALTQWFNKQGWSIIEAAYLILGYDPNLRYDKKKLINTLHNQHDSCLKVFEETERDLSRLLLKEPWHSLDLSLDNKCPPNKVAQWVEDSGYQCDKGFHLFIKDQANHIHYEHTSVLAGMTLFLTA